MGVAPAERVVVDRKFKIQFAVDPAFMEKYKRVRSLLSTKYPNVITFEMLFDILMTEYLERHGPESRMKKRSQRRENKKKRDIATIKDAKNNKPAGGDNGAVCVNRGDTGKKTRKRRSTERTRHIPQSIRDEVFVRDGGRCTFIGKNGKRCEETWNIQIDHIIPHAKGGDNSSENLRLLCPAHNRLAAEKKYGRDHMDKFYRRE